MNSLSHPNCHMRLDGSFINVDGRETSAIIVYPRVKHEVPSMTTEYSTLRPTQNGRHLADDIFKCIFLNENVWFPNKNSLKFVPKAPISNIPALVQIMAWRRPGDKPLSEPIMVSLTTHICVTRPQWVNCYERVIQFRIFVWMLLLIRIHYSMLM